MFGISISQVSLSRWLTRRGIVLFLALSLAYPVLAQRPPTPRERRATPTVPAEDLRTRLLQKRKEFLNKSLQSIGIRRDTTRRLQSLKVVKFADLRKRLYLKDKSLLQGLSGDEVKKLKRASLLSLLSKDVELNAELAKKNIDSVRDLAKISKEELIRISNGRLDDKQAAHYRNRAEALRRLVDQRRKAIAVSVRNPSPLYPSPAEGTPETHTSILRSVSGEEPTCRKCDEINNLFSPAVYLLYLLDFVEKSFGSDLDTLAEINERFKQKFEDLPISQEPNRTDSYVRYTDEILENLIAELDGNPLPNESVPTLEERAARDAIRVGIYQEFRSNTYNDEPRFDPGVLVKLFDSYVREFRTSRREVKFTRLGTDELKSQFAADHDLEVSDLALIDKADGDITLTDVRNLEEALSLSYLRKTERAVKQEFVSDIDDTTRRKFEKHFRALKKAETDRILFIDLVPAIDPAVPDYDDELRKQKERAKLCVALGQDCPSGNPYENNPINLIRELFKQFAEYYPDFTSGGDRDNFADQQIQQLREQIAQRRYAELHEEEGVDVVPPEREQELQQKAGEDAENRIRSEEEFDNQLHLLANEIFAKERFVAENNAAFEGAVRDRARENWRIAVSKAELGFHMRFRTNLIAMALRRIKGDSSGRYSEIGIDEVVVSGKPIVLTADNIQRLANYLHLDLTVDESHKTTRLAIAINRIHSFIQAIRLGTEAQYSTEDFHESTWNWLRSYGIWHAAMMVSSYPENFLIPELRRNATYQFKAVVLGDESNDEEVIQSRFEKTIDAIRTIRVTNVFAVDNKTYIFGFGETPIGDSSPPTRYQVYYSVFRENGEWLGWIPISGACLPLREHPWLFGTLEIVRLKDFFHLFSLFHSESSTSQQRKAKLMHIALPIKGELLGSSEPETSAASEEESENLWTQIGDDLAVATGIGTGRDIFAVSHPSGAATLRFIIYSAGKKDILYGGARINYDNKPEITHVGSDNVNISGEIRNIEHIDGLSDLFLWHVDDHVYLAWSPLYFDADNQLPGVSVGLGSLGNWPTNVAGSSLDNNDLLIAFNPPSKDSLRVVRVHREGTTLTAQDVATASIGYPENKAGIPNGITTTGSDIIVLSSLHRNRNYYWNVSKDKGTTLTPPETIGNVLWIDQLSDSDVARVYLDELHLHLPVMIAKGLNENRRFEEAMRWLSRLYDPYRQTEEERRIFPGFSADQLSRFSDPAIGSWLKAPFNPYALADLNRESYLINVKLAHTENLLDWADHLFTIDANESVNRARELYELAAKILGMHDWRQDDCELVWYAFRSNLDNMETDDLGASERTAIAEAILVLAEAPKREIAYRVEEVLTMKVCPAFKIAALRSIEASLASIQTLGSLLTSTQATDEAAEEAGEDLALAGISEGAFEGLGLVTIGEELPAWMPGFCLPMNPLVNLLRWRIESNLEKIRTNRNFVGMQRQMQPYATPVDPKKLVKAAASGGIDFEQFIPSTPPPIYRYSFLIERGKYLVSVAQQFEGSMLSALEKADAESYSLMKARQDLRLERANVTLQGLRLKENQDALKLANMQLDRTTFQRDHYAGLIDEGLSGWEQAALAFQITGVAHLHVAAAIKQAATWGVGGIGDVGQALLSTASLLQTQATYDRRKQEWEYQRDLTEYDIDIADIGTDIAEDRIDIVAKEKSIASTRREFASDTIEFLGAKFTNRDLYKWMSKNLRQLYRKQLNMAISTAKGAQRALEFERQTSLDFIGFDYWDDEKQGLLGAEQLLRDINKMEQFRLSTATRKREIEKTISLASIAPAEFQRFRETGVLDFETVSRGFERDFPGHYMRLIRNVSLSVIALVPPSEGIHATLSSPGISRVVVGPPFEEPSIVYRLPEAIALSSAFNATGLFELRVDDPMLLPFEGGGVATMWRLEMPKGANRFDYNTIFDVLFTIRYTALEDRSYREKVLADMGQDEDGFVSTEALRYFSIRNEFPDQWYYFHNPVIGLEPAAYADPSGALNGEGKPLPPYTMVVDLQEGDFLPNEDFRKIKKVTLAVQKSDKTQNEDARIPMILEFIRSSGSRTNANVELSGEKSSVSTQAMNGKRPYGKWILKVTDPPEGVDVSWLEDVLLIIEYKAKVHYNR